MAATAKKTGTTTRATRKPAAKPTAKPAATKKPAAKATTAKKPAAKARTTTAAKKPAAKASTPARKPAAKKSPFTPAFLAKQHQALLDERARYMNQAETLQQEADQLAADREPGDVQFDEESGEGDTIAVERERDLTLSAQARDAVRQIDEALERFDRGVYGICIHSGEPIPKARLEAIPWAAERVEFKVAKLGS
jgi:RNA polymerase-binding transcription factor DksA